MIGGVQIWQKWWAMQVSNLRPLQCEDSGSLPISYFKDLQDDKEILFKSNEILNNCIAILNEVLKNLKPNKQKMLELTNSGYITATDLADYLVQKAEIDTEKAHQIAVNCEGNISEALEKSNSDNLSTTTWFAEWMRAIYARNLSKLVQLADQFDGLAKENQKGILSYSLHIFRQCLYQISDASSLIKSLEKENLPSRSFIVNQPLR